jgi:hypothetical protein
VAPPTLAQYIARLQQRHGLLGEAIAALQQPQQTLAQALVVQYLLVGNGTKVARWANDKGHRITSATGLRQYTSADILALVQGDDAEVAPALRTLAREVAGANKDQAARWSD